MAIPKQIFQTFKTADLPLWTRYHIWKIKKKNPEYAYYFYDDDKMYSFMEEELPREYFNAFKKLNIGAAKADFFRYAILYKKGGVYLDIDSGVRTPLRKFIREDDEAIITNEPNPGLYVQWGLIFNKDHPFLKRTLEIVVDNIETRRYLHDVHATSGPTAYTKAVNECLAEDPTIPHRFLGTDYDEHLQFKYKFCKFFLYESRAEHWKLKQLTQEVMSE